jgi:PAS domain S-box-containing protein
MTSKKKRSPSPSRTKTSPVRRAPKPAADTLRPVTPKSRRGNAARTRAGTPPVPPASDTERDRRLAALENLPVYTVLLSKDHHVPFANRFFRERFGDSGGRRCFEFLFQRSEPCPDCQSFIPFRTKKLHRWEWLGPDGRTYDIYDLPFLDTDGAEFVLETGIDITECKRAEAELARVNADLERLVAQRTAELGESERRWSTTLASIGDAVIATDREGRITYLNPAAEALTGWRMKEAAGAPVGEVFRIISEDTRAPLADPVAKVLSRGRVVGLANHTLLVRKDGSEIAIDDSGAPIRAADGTITGVVLIFRDITERRAAEREIAGLARFPSENPNPVLRVDAAGAILFANESARRLFGGFLSKKEKSLPDEWLELAQRARAAGRIETAEIAEGGRTWIAAATPIPGETYLNFYAVDISELARVTRTLQAVSDSNQAMLRAQDEKSFMEAVCRIIVEECGHRMVWIGLAEQDKAKSVRPVAHFGFEEGYLETLRLTWGEGPRGHGPTGTAIRTGAPSQCRNILTDPAFKPWRADALRRGYASSIALPLTANGQTFGAVMIYAREPESFTDDEVKLLSELADDLAYGIQVLRTRAAHDELLARVEEQRWLAQQSAEELGAIFGSISDAVLVYDSGGRIRRANAAALNLLGFNPLHLSIQEIVARMVIRGMNGRPIDPVQSATMRALAGTAVRNERYRIKGAGGRELTVLSSSAPLFEDGHISGAVTVLHDISEQERITAELAEQRRLAQLSEAEARRRADELSATFFSMRDAVLVYDQGSMLRRTNRAGIGLFGSDPTGMSSVEIFRRFNVRHPDGRPIVMETRPSARALQGAAVQDEPYIFTGADGRTVSVAVSSTPLRDGDRVVGAVTIMRDVTERERLLAEMQRRAAELDAMFASMSEAVLLYDPDRTLCQINPAGVRIFGFDPTGMKMDDIIGRLHFKFPGPGLRPADAPSSRAIQGTGGTQARYNFITPDGRDVWIISSSAPLRDGERVFGAVTVVHDITEQERLLAEVQRRAAELDAVFNSIGDGVMIHGPDGVLVRMNPAAELMMGYTAADRQLPFDRRLREVIRIETADGRVVDDLDSLPVSRALRGTAVRGKELGLRQVQTGKLTWVSVTAEPLRAADGTVFGAVSSLTDITERKAFEEALHDRESTLRGILNASQESIWLFSRDHRILMGNPVAFRRLGKPPEEAIGKNLREIFPPEVAESRMERIQLTAESNQTVEFEDEHDHIILRHSCYPVLDSSGNVTSIACFSRDITAGKRSEAALRASEARFRSVLDHSRDTIYRLNLQTGGFEYISPSAETLVGHAPEELKPPDSESSLAMIHPDDLSGFRAAIARLQTSDQGQVEYRLQTKAGGWIWVSDNMSLVRDDAGRPLFRDGNLRDITVLKKTEADLRRTGDELERQVRERTCELEEANAYNRSLIEASIDPQMAITPDGKIGDVNAAAEDATGFSRVELIGTDFADYFTDPDKARAGCRRVFAEGIVNDYELELRHRDGSLMPVLYNASVYTDDSGEVRGAIAAARDITMRRRAEARSRENLRRLEVMEEISHLLAGAGLDYHSVLEKVARTAAQLLGDECHIHLLTGDGRLHLAARRKAEGGDSRPAAASHFDIPDAVMLSVLRTRRPLFLPAVSADSLRNADDPKTLAALEGSPLTALVSVPLLFQDQALGTCTVARYAGSPLTRVDLAMLSTVADRLALAITNSNLYSDLKRSLAEEQKTRQQLIQTEKLAAIGRMLGSVAHELNNPLQTIKNCLYLVEQETAGEESIKSYVDMASSETRRLVRLVAQLRDLYRPGSGADMREHDLSGILGEVRKLMQKQLADGGVAWRAAPGPKGLTVRCDKERIEQVFINLATNAIEAMLPGGGMLTAGTVRSVDGSQYGVSFRDTGPGIPEDLFDKLFDPFVTTKTSGLGLGLSICYEIAQKHGGTLEAANPPEGGASFTLWLPKADKDSGST